MKHVGKCLVRLFALFAGEENCFFGSMEEYLAVVEEIDLKELVAESEHDGVPGFEPLLDVYEALVIF